MNYVVGKRKERSGKEFDEPEAINNNNPLTPTSSDFRFIFCLSYLISLFRCLCVCETMRDKY